jgi:aminocarboxymuconate-semialdehyde decarboxylase
LKICFAHGGGNFAQQLGRVENAWHRRDIVRQDCPRPPSEYVERFSVDSAVFDDTTLRFLLDVMGESRVLMGSDYPFPLGEIHPGKMIEESPLFSDATRQAVLYDNAANFFGVGND